MLNIAFGQSKYYVDNLVENIKRGIRQKLRRGEFPGKAPVGYLNEPRLCTIVVDETKAPLVQQMFETYASGQYSLPQLRNLVATWGLVSRRGKPLTLSKMGELVSNPFFVGMFRYDGELYEGTHSPIISRKLFERVQAVMAQSGRAHFNRKHLFPFIGLLTCGECGCAITAERQKGHHYYRCTKKNGTCTQRYIREEILAAQLREAVQKVSLSEAWVKKMLDKIHEWKTTEAQTSASFAQQQQGKLSAIQEKLDRLLDAHLDGVITRAEYVRRKEKLLHEKAGFTERMAVVERKGNHWLEPLEGFIKVAYQARSVASGQNLESLKDFSKRIGSNLRLAGQSLQISYQNPWPLLAQRPKNSNWWSQRDSNPCLCLESTI